MAMPRPKNVDAYLAAVPEPGRSTLEKLRATIRSVVPPGTTEVLGYGIPMFRYEGGLLAYAAFKKHCSLFPMMSEALYERFKKELKPYRTSRGTLQFPLDRPPPATLVKRLTKARIAENLERQAARKARRQNARKKK
jgi:uncharacterized protein YdhG (YjbR/CyaY superfamily)